MTGPSGRTPVGGYPYSVPDDTVDVPRDVEALAFAIDGNAAAVIIGEVRTFGLAAAPPRWIVCDGAALEQADYPELFDALGARFNTGGETPTQFRVPNCSGRSLVGAGQGAGLTNRAPGSRWGEESHTLSTTEMPYHSHGGATGGDYPDHAHYTSMSGGTSGVTANHSHGVWIGNLAQGNTRVVVWTSGAQGSNWIAPGVGSSYFDTGGFSSDHAHYWSGANWSGGASARHQHGINAEGGGGAHNNAQPSIALLVCIYAGRL